MGRWHKISDAPETILDTAHNAAGIKNVLLQLKKINFKKLHVVLGVVKDKALDKWLGILPSKAIYYACKPMVVRGLDSSILHAALQNEGLDSRNALSAPEALKMAQNNASLDDLILVFGSNFIVADVLKATRYDQQ
jgi:dihydrofolate synthase/folylpolyglutamate synthase